MPIMAAGSSRPEHLKGLGSAWTWNLLWLQMLLSPFNSVECICAIQRGSMISPSFDWNVPSKRYPRLRCHFPLKSWCDGSKFIWSGGKKKKETFCPCSATCLQYPDWIIPLFAWESSLLFWVKMHPGGEVWIKVGQDHLAEDTVGQFPHLPRPAFPNLSNSQNSRLNETSSLFIRVGRCFSRVDDVLFKKPCLLAS